MKERTCCKIDCEKRAEFEVWPVPSPDPYEYSDACEAHVGDVLTDAPTHHVYRLAAKEPADG